MACVVCSSAGNCEICNLADIHHSRVVEYALTELRKSKKNNKSSHKNGQYSPEARNVERSRTARAAPLSSIRVIIWQNLADVMSITEETVSIAAKSA